MIRQQVMQWALGAAIFGFLMPGIDNSAHLGGFIGGYALSTFFNPLTKERGDHMLGAAVCLLTYWGLVKIPTRTLFATTTVLIALLAAGMAAQAAAFLEKANWLTMMDNVVWDSGWLLSDGSLLGKALHTLIGYTDQPTAMQLTVYLAILLVTFVLMRLFGGPVKAPQPARG